MLQAKRLSDRLTAAESDHFCNFHKIRQILWLDREIWKWSKCVKQGFNFTLKFPLIFVHTTSITFWVQASATTKTLQVLCKSLHWQEKPDRSGKVPDSRFSSPPWGETSYKHFPPNWIIRCVMQPTSFEAFWGPKLYLQSQRNRTWSSFKPSSITGNMLVCLQTHSQIKRLIYYY